MAKSNNGTNTTAQSIVLGKLEQQAVMRRAQDIETWRRALRIAETIGNQNRVPLYDLYDDILLDGRLEALLGKRRTNVTNKHVAIHNDKGEPMGDLLQHFQTPWFRDLKGHIIDSIFWGHSLIELITDRGKVVGAELVPRKHVRPEFGDILIRQGDPSQRIAYTEPVNADYLLPVGSRDNLGLLLKAVPYIVYKRGAFGDWAQYAELFGMPFRLAKYKAYDNKTRNILEAAMRDMGSASYMVIPEEASVEIQAISGTGDNSGNYDMLRQACNEELAVLILGQTMTTTDGSSRAQSETHFKVEEQITLDDILFLEFVLNWAFKQMMIRHGCPLDGCTFRLPETEKLPKEVRLDMLLRINNEVAPIDPEYIAKEFDVPLLGKPIEAKIDKGNIENNKQKEAEKKKFNLIDDYYNCPHNHNHPAELTTLADPDNEVQTAFDNLTEAIYNASIPTDTSIHEPLYNALAKALYKEISFDFANEEQEGEAFKAAIQNNIHAFSCAKSYTELMLMRQSLLDDKGDILPFHQFKDRVSGIYDKYNIAHLQAEYLHVIAAAQAAGQWNEIEANKDNMPYLRYLTANDDRVRETHRTLNNIVVPVDDPFWDTYYPPNGWRCRCDVAQITNLQAQKSKYSIKTGDDAGRLAKEALDNKKFFGKNFAKASDWFDATHPNFKGLDTTKLSAEKDYGIKPPKATTAPLPLLSQDEFEQQWQTLTNGSTRADGFVWTDVLKTPLYADKKLYDHLIKNEKPRQPHYSVFNRAQATISQPDEIWFGWIESTKKGRLAKVHLKFYSDKLIVVFSDEQLNIISIYAAPLDTANHYRKGILLYRKK